MANINIHRIKSISEDDWYYLYGENENEELNEKQLNTITKTITIRTDKGYEYITLFADLRDMPQVKLDKGEEKIKLRRGH